MKKYVKIDYGPEEKRVISREQFIRGFLKFCEMCEHTPSEKELKNVEEVYERKNYFIIGSGDTNGNYKEEIIECDNFD